MQLHATHCSKVLTIPVYKWGRSWVQQYMGLSNTHRDTEPRVNPAILKVWDLRCFFTPVFADSCTIEGGVNSGDVSLDRLGHLHKQRRDHAVS